MCLRRMSWKNLTHAKINLLLRKHNQCQDKFAMVEAQDHMRPRCVSQENLTRTKINLLGRRHQSKCAQDVS
ncbi:hypothetical protein BHE74_00059368 [Ensete ventricosum]|nr:hypothetical protein BHE74_00059368 [Ensete ventricosum]RZS16817.1 hypothetical protein BHM03_00048865 [Ensete ventricosum]